MNKYILDSSAVLALINEETGASAVEKLLSQSVISSVNLAEVIARLALEGVPARDAFQAVSDLVQEVVSFEAEDAQGAGALAFVTRPHGLSLGDRACLATAARLRLEAVTADRVWGKLKLPIKIKIIR